MSEQLYCGACRTTMPAKVFNGECPVCGNGTVQEIGPRIPSPDEHKPAAPEPAPERDVPCKTPGCNYAMVPLEEDGWYVCTKCRAVHQVKQHSQPCPVTVERVREIAGIYDRSVSYSTGRKCWKDPEAEDLRALADWLGGQQQ